MVRRIASGFVAVLILSAAGCTPAMKEYSNADGKFKAQFPGTPKEQSQAQAGIPTKMFGVEEKDGAYMISYTDMPFPGDMPQALIDQSLDGSVEGMIKGGGGTKTGSSSIKLADKHPGRSIDADVPGKGGIMRARIYLVGKRLYQVLVVGKAGFVKSDTATKFLDSFELLP